MTIVLVEDHINLRRALSSMLQSEGFSVVPLECAEDIDDTLGTRAADAYIIDLNLPGEDGLNLIKRVRKTEPGANIIITTAHSDLEWRVKGYEAGADVFLPKPVDPAELVAVLRSRIRRSETSPPRFALDTTEQVLFGAQQPISLTLAETRMLSALSLANDRLLESWQLMSQFTPEDGSMSAEGLQMRLSRLRRKFLKAGIDGEVIRAERGLGYRLCLDIKVI